MGIGAPDRIRTCDLCLRRAALYPAELRVQIEIGELYGANLAEAVRPAKTRKNAWRKRGAGEKRGRPGKSPGLPFVKNSLMLQIN